MPASRQVWKQDDIAKLEAMAARNLGSGSPQSSAEPLERQRSKLRGEGFRCASNVPAELPSQTRMAQWREAFLNLPQIGSPPIAEVITTRE